MNAKTRKLVDRLLLIVSILLITVALVRWLYPQEDRQYNVLLITLDTTRTDRLGAYGRNPSITPNLDKIAEYGVSFDNASCNVPLTLPSHSSLMTGLLPPEHGLRLNSRDALAGDVPVLAEIFTANGYSTGAFIASPVLDSKYGLDRGFGVYDDKVDIRTAIGEKSESMYRRGDIVAAKAISWLKKHKNLPFFCWVHLYDPHLPYYAHQQMFGDKYKDSPYDAEIAFTDIQVGKMMAALSDMGVIDNTLVIAVADHGESLEEDPHPEPRPHHGYMLYDPATKIPMLIYLPDKIPPGSRCAQQVSIVDLYPTIPELAGIAPPQAPNAVSLLKAIKGKEQPSRSVYAETLLPGSFGWGQQRMIRTPDWKYVESPVEELYNLSLDPEEKDNLAETQPGQLQAFRAILADLTSKVTRGKGKAVTLTEEEMRNIQSLGYAGGGVAIDTDNPTDLDSMKDIKTMIPALEMSNDAQELMQDRKYEQALKLWDIILEKSPETITFRVLHASALMNAGQAEQAENILRDLLVEARKDGKDRMLHMILNNLAWCLVKMERHEEAMPYIKKALGLEPGQATYHHTLANVFAGLGNMQKALLAARMAFKIDPANPEHLVYCAKMEIENEHYDKARSILEIVMEADFDEYFKTQAEKLLNKL